MDQTLEQWRPVVGYEGLYEVSSFGRVRSLFRAVKRGAGNQRVRAKLMKLTQSRGYAVVGLSREGKTTVMLVHLIVMKAFVGDSGGLDCRHLDGNGQNNCLSNLCYGTRKENEQDKLRHGTRAHGSRNGRSRLTEADVCFIRAETKLSGVELAARFQVSQACISMIKSRTKWAYLDA